MRSSNRPFPRLTYKVFDSPSRWVTNRSSSPSPSTSPAGTDDQRWSTSATVLDYPCIEFAEEFMYGQLRREQLVKRWEGDTLIVEITRKIPPGDELHDWYRR